MNEKKENTYFILIKIGEYKPTQDRKRETFQSLKDCFDRIAGQKHKLVFTSKDTDYSGYFVKTRLRNTHAVKAHILGTISNGSHIWEKEYKKPTSSSLLSGDSVLVIQIPDDGFSNDGFSRACTWLNYH